MTEAHKTDENGPGSPSDDEDQQPPETFDRAYVEQLRAEAAEHRVRAKRADELARRLLMATVREATAGILTDPTDLPVDDGLLDDDGYPDPDKIAEAAKALAEHKPHLADRRPTDPVDQGARGDGDGVNLAGVLRRLAG